MPDIAQSRLDDLVAPLDEVGMSNIQIPICIRSGDMKIPVLALAHVFVNIADPRSKGIHMSRLFLLLEEFAAMPSVSLKEMQELLDRFVASHQDMSDAAYVTLKFQLPLRRKALISANYGWRAYPFVIHAGIEEGQRSSRVSFEVDYSSTCPCSAALARQLIQDKFSADFSEVDVIPRHEVVHWLGLGSSILATPHGQRSTAKISVFPKDPSSEIALSKLIDRIEEALQTPVQAAVKREDEQEFARLNGTNLMFAEDAARKMKQSLDSDLSLAGYSIEAHHFESLHAHDAVAKVCKNPS
jgi:GTP cyclohydrolase I